MRVKAFDSIIPNHGGIIVKNSIEANIIIVSSNIKMRDFNFLFPKVDRNTQKQIHWNVCRILFFFLSKKYCNVVLRAN